MPKNNVNDPITDQEIAFARLVLSGTMTDRHAAEAVGLNPDSAAYTKAKPHVHAYMLEHRAAVEQQLVQQEADLSRLSRRAVEPAVEGQRRLNLDRKQVLNRLWELANLSSEMTRNSITGQVKAIAMIVAMQNLIPSRLTVSAEKKSAPAPVTAQIYQSEWLRKQKAATSDPHPTPPRLSRLPRQAVGLALEPSKNKHPACPNPNPLPAQWQRRLRTPSPISPPSPIAFPSRMTCRLMSPSPRLFQTPGFLSLSE